MSTSLPTTTPAAAGVGEPSGKMDFDSEFDPNAIHRPLKHPVVTFSHLFFRSSALFLYLFGGFFSNSFIGLFVCIVLLLSLDFWTVKNITGRIMVSI